MSAATRSRNVGAAADPLPGPAKTRFADSLTSATVIVPAVVTGDPETVKISGTASPIEVTDPPATVPTPWSG